MVYRHALLKKMDPSALKALMAQAEEVSVEKNRALFFQTEVADGVYYVCEGLVKVIRVSPMGQEKIFSLYTGGQFMALSTLFNPPHRYPATAIAIERTRVIKIPRPLLEAGILSTKEATCEWFRQLNRRLEGVQQLMTDHVFMGAEERFKKWMHQFLKQKAENDNGWLEVTVPISRQEIADLLGIRRETLSRLLQELRQEGHVEVDGRTFKVNRSWLLADES